MVLAIAHRGADSLAPENTIPAIRKAWEIGADIVEVDVTTTLDGRLILLHDDLLIRTTDIAERFPERMNNPCWSFTLQELKILDAGSWFITTDPFGQIAAGNVSRDELSSFKGLPIPTLDEVLDFVNQRSWRINIEIKEVQHLPIIESVLALINRMQISADRLIISSFFHDSLRKVRSQRPDIEINALIGGDETGNQQWGDYEFMYYNADAELTDEEQIARAQEHNCRVSLYTVNNPDQMLRFIRAGIHSLFTDFPQRLVALLKE